ncbi:MAG: DUF402 domain-containing protein [Candidatus Bathyarchaeia archaeon]
MRAKVRGIYATALTKLLLENGFQIVQPSQTIKARFNLQENNDPPDIKIKDRRDLQGVLALGKAQVIEAFRSIIHDSLEDAITRKWEVSVGGIYKGTIVGEDEDAVYVQIKEGNVGKLLKWEATGESQNTVVVQVERKGIGKKTPFLTTKLKIIGKHAILVKDGKVGVSLKICDINRRAELYALGEKLVPKGWGIIWRELAAKAQKDFLEKEVAELANKVKNLDEKAKSAEAPSLLVDGLYFMDVEFPKASKRKLDELRATVAHTICGHHFYKSCGGKASAALEMAEKLLEKGQNREEVEKFFKRQILPEFPEEGSTVDLEHVKLSGLVLRLGQATIESIGEDKIRYWRTIKTDGFYDGLGAARKAGDKAVSETKPDEWYIITSYFSRDGEWKGTYVNLNTPVEVYPRAIRYVDLEVDICILPNGEVKVLDVEKLEEAFKKGLLSKTIFQKIKNAVEIFTGKDFVEKLKANFN